MRSLAVFVIALLVAISAFAQNRSGFVNTPSVNRTGTSWVFPAGTSAMPGVQRTTGSVLFPAGGGPQIGIPSAGINPNLNLRPGGNGFTQNVPGRPGFRGTSRGTGAVYVGYPIYVGGGGYYDPSYYGQQGYGQQGSPQQGSVTVIYPPQPAPVIINQFGQPGEGQYTTSLQGPVQSQTSEPPSASGSEPAHYLIAFKDHTIYSAVAYWVDGDTLHYFTNGNTHNQVSVSLIDRDLTARLNQDSGVEVKLPAAK
jgi:hypothetical protein